MAWQEIKMCWLELLQQAADPATNRSKLISGWDKFRKEVLQCSDHPPYHLYCILKQVKKFCGQPPASDKAILDHGCGSALTIFYLAVLGYENIVGVDISNFAGQERIAEAAGLQGVKFVGYDGGFLPFFKDNSFNFIFSQQVLEHVRDEQLDIYYSEEARILRVGGAALHEVPHRLVPYDSHNQVWFVHYLPDGISKRLMPFFMGDREPLSLLFHRWPWHHRQKVTDHIGSCLDLTIERLRNTRDLDYYDGPVGVRRIINKVLDIPVIGRTIEPLLRNLVMLETLSEKISVK